MDAVEISPLDLEIDVYRSPLNDRAVRITHKPSGVSVCSDDGSTREENFGAAMKLLHEALDR
jgi:protein subunit release factor A